MCTNPLNEYFALSGTYFDFKSPNTALWRGYVGTWELLYERLYLLGINGTLQDGRKVTLDLIFPGFTDRVFAHWYSGTLRIPRGDLINYKHSGYSSTYERDLLVKVERGVIKRRWIRENQKSENEKSCNTYVVQALTHFGTSEDEMQDK